MKHSSVVYTICIICNLALVSVADVIPAPVTAAIIPSDEMLSNMMTSTVDAIKLVKSSISAEGGSPPAALASSSDGIAIVDNENNTQIDAVTDYILNDSISKPPSLFVPPVLPPANLLPATVVQHPPIKKENKHVKKSTTVVKTKELWEAKDMLCHIEGGELICVHVKLDDISFDASHCGEEIHGDKKITICKKKL
jgi:hypothetical protein